MWRVGVGIPHIQRAFRHHIDMAIEDQRSAGIAAAVMGANHVDGIIVISDDRREARQLCNVVDVNQPAIRPVPAFG